MDLYGRLYSDFFKIPSYQYHKEKIKDKSTFTSCYELLRPSYKVAGMLIFFSCLKRLHWFSKITQTYALILYYKTFNSTPFSFLFYFLILINRCAILKGYYAVA